MKLRSCGNPYDLSSLRQIASSGVMWSAEIKAGLLRHHDMLLNDVMGSTEGGMGGSVTSRDASVATAKFQLNEGVVVITDDGRRVAPGSGEIGKVATSGFVPVGYYKDPVKSAADLPRNRRCSLQLPRRLRDRGEQTAPSRCSDAAVSVSIPPARRSFRKRSKRR